MNPFEMAFRAGFRAEIVATFRAEIILLNFHPAAAATAVAQDQPFHLSGAAGAPFPSGAVAKQQQQRHRLLHEPDDGSGFPELRVDLPKFRETAAADRADRLLAVATPAAAVRAADAQHVDAGEDRPAATADERAVRGVLQRAKTVM